jgi:hypothetical protein
MYIKNLVCSMFTKNTINKLDYVDVDESFFNYLYFINKLYAL